MSKSGARNRKNTTKSLDDDDDDDDFSFDLKEEDDGESKRSSYLNDFDRARGVTKAEKLRRENAFEYFATSPANPPKASRRWSKTSFVAAAVKAVEIIGRRKKLPLTTNTMKKRKTKLIHRRNLQP